MQQPVLETVLVNIFVGVGVSWVLNELLFSQVAEYDDIEELEEGEWIPDDPDFWKNFSDKIVDDGMYYLRLMVFFDIHLSIIGSVVRTFSAASLMFSSAALPHLNHTRVL